ncbi:MAG: DNA photolyase [Alphaproteobacteria bacterium]|nr:DNA photolyase [Alphaproteobacteria bacterium]
MIDTVYFEEDVLEYPAVSQVKQALPKANWVPIERFQELFNIRNQNFRIQKKNPALILAKKYENFVLPVPSGFGMSSSKNFYFSHMYNCLYDCNYCFLQGLYSSANFVLFVNYEDFFEHISQTIEKNKNDTQMFFSGYDCDSLAFDKVSGFSDNLIQFFEQHPNVEVELRTKSIVTSSLLRRNPIKNCIIAFSLSPHIIANKLDNKAPSIARRIDAMKKLADSGWQIGLRLDPLIYTKDWKNQYAELIFDIMSQVKVPSVHSVSYGLLRFPKKMYKKISTLHNDSGLFAFPMHENNEVISYGKEIENDMYSFIQRELHKYLPETKIFHCTN